MKPGNILTILIFLSTSHSWGSTQFTFKDFKFSPGKTCETGWIDSSFCEATMPKPWTESEYQAMSTLIATVYEGKLPHFLAQILENGFDTFYRYSFSFQRRDQNKYERLDFVGLWVWGVDKSINIADGILNSGDSPLLDPYSKIDIRVFSVFHEMVHAFSMKLAESKEFLDLIGWVPEGTGHIIRGIAPEEMVLAMTQMKKLSNEKKYEELLKLNREFGIKHGFPSAYSMTIPQECFADLAAYIYLDPKVDEYLKPEWIAWFRKNVLN